MNAIGEVTMSDIRKELSKRFDKRVTRQEILEALATNVVLEEIEKMIQYQRSASM